MHYFVVFECAFNKKNCEDSEFVRKKNSIKNCDDSIQFVVEEVLNFEFPLTSPNAKYHRVAPHVCSSLNLKDIKIEFSTFLSCFF